MKREAKLVVDPSLPVPIYRQVVDNLRSLLVEGVLEAGDTLPTVREMGLELGVHFNTVAEAYRLLAEEGWLELKRRRGAVVLERAMPRQQPESADRLRRGLRQLVAQVRSDGLSTASILDILQEMSKELSV